MNMHRRPDRAVVEAVLDREAFAARICRRDVIEGQSAAPTRVRRRVWQQVILQTGCSMSGLADVWGCDRQAVRRGLIKAELATAAIG